MKKTYLLGALVLASLPAQSAIIKDGSFYDYVAELKNLAFSKNSGDYVAPTAGQRSDFSLLAKSLYDHNWSIAETQANFLGYDLIQFNNSTTQDVYWGVAEQLIDGKQSKGWGSYFINEASTSNVTIEVTHPSNDTNTHRLGARVFERSDANAFAMAGSHRSANGYQTANPTSLEYSIFQEVHKIFNGGYGDSTAWQLHGFGSSTLKKFPEGTDAVLSDGAGNVTNELATLDRLLEEIDDNQFGTSYVYNLLDKDDPLNIQVNGVDQDGHDPFYHLRAFNNPQGQFSRDAGVNFVHIEASYNIRGSRTKRDTYFANAIVEAIKETSTGTAGYVDDGINDIPEPSNAVFFLASLFILPLWRKAANT